jgi:hypothetical protein
MLEDSSGIFGACLSFLSLFCRPELSLAALAVSAAGLGGVALWVAMQEASSESWLAEITTIAGNLESGASGPPFAASRRMTTKGKHSRLFRMQLFATWRTVEACFSELLPKRIRIMASSRRRRPSNPN